MDPLLPSFRRDLRARAHHLHPVVSVGHHGLTPSVLHEIDVALIAHELVKVRVFVDDREARQSLLVRICKALDCAAVQSIGKLLVVWRPRPAPGDRDGSAMKSAADRGRRSDGEGRQWPAAPTRRRRAGAAQDVSPAGRVRQAAIAPLPAATKRERMPPGKAPAGVPRAAPRRRRRAP
jgi:putative YhbY family RNA-binding protein